MDRRLRDILTQVRDQGDASGLSEVELSYLGDLLGDRPESADDAKPLWVWVQRQALLFNGLLDFDPNNAYLPGLDALLADAGVDVALRQPLALLHTPIRRSALHAAVRRNVTSSESDRRSGALLMVGLAEFEDLLPIVVDALASGREDRRDYPQPMIAACLQTLVRLGHPRARELAMKYVDDSDYAVRMAVLAALLCSDEAVDIDHLVDRFVAQGRADRLLWLPRLLTRAVSAGQVDEATLRQVISQNQYRASHAMRAARLLVDTDQRDLFVALLSEEVLAPALALAVAWTDATWALEPLRAAMANASGSPLMAMVAAVATLSETPEAFVRSQLAIDDPNRTLGAIWGAMGRPALDADLRPLRAHDSAQVRRAARFVLAHNAGSPEPALSELLWLDLLTESAWWPWQIAIDATDRTGQPRPPVVELFRVISSHPPLGDAQRLDQAIAAFGAEPWHLVRWLDPSDTDHDQQSFALLFAGCVGGPLVRSTLEQRLLQQPDLHSDAFLVIALSAMGGALTRLGQLRTQLALADYNSLPSLQPDQRRAASQLALSSQGELATRAIRALGTLESDVEEELLLLLCRPGPQADAAADLAAGLPHLQSSVLADISDLVSGRVHRIADLRIAPQLLRIPSERVRRALADGCTHPDNSASEVVPLLLAILTHQDAEPDTVAAALTGLVTHLPGRDWVRDRIIELSHGDHWNAAELSLRIMSHAEDPVFLHRIGEILAASSDNHGQVDSAMQAIRRLSTAHPDIGVIDLDVRDPWPIREQFGLDEDVDYAADQTSEALRLMMIGLERRIQPEVARDVSGRRLLFTPLTGDLPPPSMRIAAETVRPLLMFLRVLFADEDTGAVVAEVGETSSGEILTALLQTRPVVGYVASWS